MRALLALLLFIPASATAATAGRRGLEEIRQCIMQNDTSICHADMTPDSYNIFDRFSGYNLMPCLPTDFTYSSEHTSGKETIVTVLLPEDAQTHYTFHMVFVESSGKVKLNLPETFRVGFGPDWQNKINLGEQLFLMMRQNMRDKLTCDVLRNLAEPKKNKI